MDGLLMPLQSLCRLRDGRRHLLGFRTFSSISRLAISKRTCVSALALIVVNGALWFCCLPAVCYARETSVVENEDAAGNDWPYYNGPSGTHYSLLKDIDTDNVSRLKIAWVYDTRDEVQEGSTIESNPIIVNGDLYFVSPNGRLICLDGGTGRELWTFEPDGVKRTGPDRWARGVSYWTDGKEHRILFALMGKLYALNADTGLPENGFGSNGRVAVATNHDSTTPGAVYKDTIVVGGANSVIQAFDVRTGKLRWAFHTVPGPGKKGYDTWPEDAWKKSRGANNWAGMTLDKARGLLFLPLGDPIDSFYGADRAGNNLFSNSLVALDVNTGRLVWYFQTVRHDLWDRDLPAPPALITVTHKGKRVDAVALVTKLGFIYLLDRATGKSLSPLVERKAFGSELFQEVVAPTQVEPKWPAPFARQHLTEDLLTHRTPEAHLSVLAKFKTLSSQGLWDPPSERGTIMLPCYDGGAGWGGAAYDSQTHLLYVNSNEMPCILKLEKHVLNSTERPSSLYLQNCASCHGENRTGRPPEYPSLIGITDRLSAKVMEAKITDGGVRMPDFKFLGTERIAALVNYFRTGVDMPIAFRSKSRAQEIVYSVKELSEFLDPEGYPAMSPPWGTLNAVDLNTGHYAWKIPFGEFPELVAKGITNTGSPNYGGPVVTAGGLLFIGATSFDRKFRAYDKRTGKLLWQTVLPNAGIATPATYRVNGRQFVVIPAGGGRPAGSKSGTQIVAFALPQ